MCHQLIVTGAAFADGWAADGWAADGWPSPVLADGDGVAEPEQAPRTIARLASSPAIR
jgi:hypothetical protein